MTGDTALTCQELTADFLDDHRIYCLQGGVTGNGQAVTVAHCLEARYHALGMPVQVS